jgi:hypothetical protein
MLSWPETASIARCFADRVIGTICVESVEQFHFNFRKDGKDVNESKQTDTEKPV